MELSFDPVAEADGEAQRRRFPDPAGAVGVLELQMEAGAVGKAGAEFAIVLSEEDGILQSEGLETRSRGRSCGSAQQ
jgi:hypothetical protein